MYASGVANSSSCDITLGVYSMVGRSHERSESAPNSVGRGGNKGFIGLQSIVFLTLALIADSPSTVGAQSVRGLLLERVTDRPIALGAVTMLDQRGDTVASGLSDERGFFSFSGSHSGTFFLIAQALGYRPQRTEPFVLEQQ